MNEIITPEHRDALIDMFTNVVKSDVLTNMEALEIVKILEQACHRASAELEEKALLALIEGDWEDDSTQGFVE